MFAAVVMKFAAVFAKMFFEFAAIHELVPKLPRPFPEVVGWITKGNRPNKPNSLFFHSTC